jgi:hypothetical protein
MTTIANIQALPTSPYEGTGLVAIVITSGIPSYFRLTGADLNRIVSVRWFPKHPGTLLFETRQLILVDNNEGTFMIRVLDNYLDTNDRAGRIIFTLDDETTLSAPVVTYGPVSVGPLWTPANAGLITG